MVGLPFPCRGFHSALGSLLRPPVRVLCLFLPLVPGVAETLSVRRVAVTDDTVVRLATQVRHTTVLAVPEDERILEFVLGDPDRWGLSGAANIALLKPMAAGARTSVTLVTDAGRIYAFTAEEGAGDPDLMVHVRRAVPRPGRAELPAAAATPAPVPVSVAAFPPVPVLASAPGPSPPLPFRAAVPFLLPPVEATPPGPVSAAAFPPAPVLAPAPGPDPPLLSRAAVPVLLPAWAAAPPVPVPEAVPVPGVAHAVGLPAATPPATHVALAPADAPVPEPSATPATVPDGVTAPDGEQPAGAPVLTAAPRGTMRFEYALDAAARGDPFRVVAMWNDGGRTWFRSPAAGLWDVYAAGDGFGGARVACEPVEEGLCAVRAVLGDGVLRMGGLEARWELRPVRDPR